jgi:transposase InsO family protein
MKYTAAKKMEIINIVNDSPLSIKKILSNIGIPRSSFYEWAAKYDKFGFNGLIERHKPPFHVWNRIPDSEREKIIEKAGKLTDFSCRELAIEITDKDGYFISESSVYRILKKANLIRNVHNVIISAKDEFEDKTSRVNEMWQTDFTYFKIVDWGWYYLSTILDDFSRRILAWRLCETMGTEDATKAIDDALTETGVSSLPEIKRPCVLSDNGPSYISKDFIKYLGDNGMSYARGRPYHPQTQGKIERYHQTMKNRLLINIYHSPAELKQAIEKWVKYYNEERPHESLGNITPSDKYFGREEIILKRRTKLKEKTLKDRIKINQKIKCESVR